MSLFGEVITEGNEKADELAKEGAMMDRRYMAQKQARSSRKEMKCHYAASFHRFVEEWTYCEELEPRSREKWIFVNKKRGAKKPSGGVV